MAYDTSHLLTVGHAKTIYDNLKSAITNLEDICLAGSNPTYSAAYTDKGLNSTGWGNTLEGYNITSAIDVDGCAYISADYSLDIYAYKAIMFFTSASMGTGVVSYKQGISAGEKIEIPATAKYVRFTYDATDTPVFTLYESAFDALEAEINEKQDTLTFDDIPTSSSSNPVKSGGVYSAISDIIRQIGENNLGFELGTLYDGVPHDGSNRCRNINFIPVVPGDMVFMDGAYDISVTEYDSNHVFVRVSGWLPGKKYSVVSGNYIKIVARKNDQNPDLTDADVSAVNAAVYVLNIDAKLLDIKAQMEIGENYAISADLSKTALSVALKGALTYLQSFCIYDDHYYSTNGSNVSVQDSTFTETNNVAISLGHGNAMQIGTANNNYAYISGWDDQKVYVLDLDTLTLVNTITLPTTGYTTAAIDDVNGLAYIFQRTTYPTTEEHYNFIVYDYVNETIIRTRKTDRAFAAMQAVDYVEGKIFVLNGGGTQSMPNYYLIYNTMGDVIGEYVLSDFEANEPEGVFIDRETKKIYISLGNKNLYEIS